MARTAADARLDAWFNDTDAANLLADVEAFIGEYVAFPTDHALVAVVLWTAHAHTCPAFESSPRLALLSPEPGSGKTRVLEVLEVLCPAPMHVLSASAAAIFRSIQDAHRTLLFDEVDAIFGRRGSDDSAEDLRALLNSGHRRGAHIPRCVGPRHEVREFATFAPAALAGLGDLPDTLMSRSVIIRMRRRAPGETVTPYRRRIAEPRGRELRGRLESWAGNVFESLLDAWPVMPDGVTDRPADVWEPLLAVADAVGGDWPDRARAACVALANANVAREASLGVKLLTDLRAVFGDEDKMHTETILARLHDLDESPWSDLRGKPIDARGLARRLGQYEVGSCDVRLGDSVKKGYTAESLYDAWRRYLPPPQESATSATTATQQVTGTDPVADEGPCSATDSTSATESEPATSHVAAVAAVAPNGRKEGRPAGPPWKSPHAGDPLGRQPCDVCGAPTHRHSGTGYRHSTCEVPA